MTGYLLLRPDLDRKTLYVVVHLVSIIFCLDQTSPKQPFINNESNGSWLHSKITIYGVPPSGSYSEVQPGETTELLRDGVTATHPQ